MARGNESRAAFYHKFSDQTKTGRFPLERQVILFVNAHARTRMYHVFFIKRGFFFGFEVADALMRGQWFVPKDMLHREFIG